jgi:hypothetical protein
MTFELALPSIMGQESSFCKFKVGDNIDKNGKKKSLYYSTLGCFHMKLSTAKIVLKKYPEIFSYLYDDIYFGPNQYKKYKSLKKHISLNKKILNKSKLLKQSITKDNTQLKKYLVNLKKDIYLIKELKDNFEFSALLSGYYIKYCYDKALEKNFKSIYRNAIGRYNGGWGNFTYFNNVKKRMKFVKKHIRYD